MFGPSAGPTGPGRPGRGRCGRPRADHGVAGQAAQADVAEWSVSPSPLRAPAVDLPRASSTDLAGVMGSERRSPPCRPAPGRIECHSSGRDGKRTTFTTMSLTTCHCPRLDVKRTTINHNRVLLPRWEFRYAFLSPNPTRAARWWIADLPPIRSEVPWQSGRRNDYLLRPPLASWNRRCGNGFRRHPAQPAPSAPSPGGTLSRNPAHPVTVQGLQRPAVFRSAIGAAPLKRRSHLFRDRAALDSSRRGGAEGGGPRSGGPGRALRAFRLPAQARRPPGGPAGA